ncbi:MBOAT family O-acyltransferase [Granulicella tundricola]|uniref:Membrane bound O-acyl transferase MBOAT family protein n=1 Tax=Granulicella tundricola (strain ATCC BAA-1859 / DSM 23138 / MP5ACTX9) TaxID=1198114 RepID=E8WY17_GRATM|nr:MBOAT family O-acyltransferase [Granulicella tundricola]ADW67556.1 membrane bound O-acyl transferase MBOAT family protein [Granulicella tundricola MP5ACTX9]
MLFSSGTFIFLFLPASLIGYQILSRFGRTAMLSWLAMTSLFFYGYWNPAYLLLLLGSIVMNFLFARMLGEGRPDASQSRWLVAAIAANLALLMYYKYLFPLLNFFHAHGIVSHGFQEVMLPLGISFFTFTQIAYLIDLRQMIAKRQGLLSYSVFVTFFPHLIAGPVIHPREMMPQLEGRLRGLKAADLSLGLSWFILGLAKKVLIADRISPLADILFAHPASAGFSLGWLGSVAYAMQLYFDFSGYSDMALGIARMFSIEFPVNFNSPYKAQGIIEFWQRWHMTLSRYLNEYLYTPISRSINGRRMDAGKKVTRKATATLEGFSSMVALPVMTTMFLAGIWHGAGLQFLIFGVLHGTYLTINHAWRIFTPEGHRFHRRVPAPLMILLSFVCFVISLVFFRSANVHDALYILGTMAGAHGRHLSFNSFPYLAEIPSISKFLRSLPSALLALGVCFFIVWGMPNTQEILGQLGPDQKRKPSLLPRLSWKPTTSWSLGLAMIFCIAILLLDASTRFLYFQF